MLLDMTQLLGGAVDRLDFSYTLSADRVPYEGAEALLDGENTDAQRIGDNEENEGIYPIVFDDVVVLEPVAVNGSVINRAGYITLTAEASMSYRTHCARCLAEVEDTVRFLCEKTVADEKVCCVWKTRKTTTMYRSREESLTSTHRSATRFSLAFRCVFSARTTAKACVPDVVPI